MINLLMPVIAALLIGSSALFQPSQQVPENLSLEVKVNDDAIVLTEGIVGGFIPPLVRLKIIFVPGRDDVDVWVKSQPERTAKARFLKGKMGAKEFKKLTASIQKKKFWKLPVESPQGSQDIYQLDTSLNIRLGKRSWANGGPQGCVHGQSKIQASDEQRKRFSQIVDLLKTSATQHAKTEVEAKSFESVAQEVARSKNNK